MAELQEIHPGIQVLEPSKPITGGGEFIEGRKSTREEEMNQKTELRDGMKIDWNVPLTMDDGIVLRADVYRPVREGRYPVILTYGVYAKGLSYQEGYPLQWQMMVESYPSGILRIMAMSPSLLFRALEGNHCSTDTRRGFRVCRDRGRPATGHAPSANDF